MRNNPYLNDMKIEKKTGICCSVVIPVYNEEESLEVLFQELLKEVSPFGENYEIIFVNDGSSDQSLSILEGFKSQYPDQVHILSSNDRSGQSFSLKQGFRLARGKIVISLDADLQNDPADMRKLINKLEEGYDCVCGWRKFRKDTQLKAFFSKFGNVLQRLITGLKIHDLSCTLRVYTNECVKKINLESEGWHRFIPLDLFLKGYKVGEVIVNHRERRFGHSKYSHRRFIKVVKDFLKIIKSKDKK